ncbi:MAG: ferredoxin [Gammaproteobacteria bacterium]|nr:MAG: ferredoxin [Gammaproteobacteria bacterium]RTZ75835.1 MAG: ferredoxin [Gammaproteobacteria bacterium]RTZ76698.1 MAG: ferredoxin [Gammaproteobacteria bacterium]
MNLCSLIVHTRPEKGQQVEERLNQIPGVEVHGGVDEGKLIVTVEDTEDAPASDTMMSFNDIEGVISATLIYHYGGDDLNEEVIRELN